MNQARCPNCHKALLLKWEPGSTRRSPVMETTCRSCRALVSFELIPSSTKPIFHKWAAREPVAARY